MADPILHPRYMQLESPAMGRKVHLWCYGHYGPPVIAFPSAAGFSHEWDKQGMIDVLRPWIAGGGMKLYCPESNVSEVWTRKDAPIQQRMDRHRAYEGFVLDTLIPFIEQDCRWPGAPLTAMGCSLGGTYAALFALKFPERFRRALCLSGRYLTTELTHGESCDALYFNNPLAFVPGLHGAALDRVRENTHLTLVCGQGAFEEGCIEETIALGRLLPRKGIPSITDIWDQRSRHDWDWWQKQLLQHARRMF